MITIRATGSKHVLKQMQMEAQECKQRCLPFLGSERECNRSDESGERHVMKRVVKERKPQQGMGRVSCKEFGNNAEAVDIGNDARKRDQGAVSSLQGEAVCENPSREEMSDRTHEVGPVRLLEFNQHIAVLNLQRIYGNFGTGILIGLPGLCVPRPAMPWADNLAAFDHSLA